MRRTSKMKLPSMVSCHWNGIASFLLLSSARRSFASLPGSTAPKRYRTLQVQIVHRHGDRTPITPLKDAAYWESTLVPSDLLEKIEEGTRIVRKEEDASTQASSKHAAGGRGPFGKLTKLGLFQMVDLGTKLREELVQHDSDEDRFHADPHGNLHSSTIFRPSKPLSAENVRVVSTDFPRTIQSVQGVLVGLFPDGVAQPPQTGNNRDATIDIDVRHTHWMIPDPQPRRTTEQVDLEEQIMAQPHIAQKEQAMKPLAMRTTDALRHLLDDGAFDMKFGVGEEIDDGGAVSERPLPWAQLAEITKCLKVRDLLPSTIPAADQHEIMQYLGQKWFDCLRHPRLSYLAMNTFATALITNLQSPAKHPPLHLYSAHDSALIGLLCAFRLNPPKEWPPYGSFLKIELVEMTAMEGDAEPEHVVRFSLNGKTLECEWSDREDCITLERLVEKVTTEGASA